MTKVMRKRKRKEEEEEEGENEDDKEEAEEDKEELGQSQGETAQAWAQGSSVSCPLGEMPAVRLDEGRRLHVPEAKQDIFNICH